MELLIDPNVAYVILVIGFVMGVLALFAPGSGVLEIGALLAMAFAGYAMAVLPINIWALILIVVSVILFIFAVRKHKHWVYLVPSIIAIIVGTIFLYRKESGAPAIDPFVATFMSIITVLFLWFITRKGVEALQLRPAQDLSALIGQIGVARSDIRQSGSIYVGGEEWTARSTKLIHAGQQARVVDRDGLILVVEAVKEEK
ncbi:MAG: hypothetical protein KBD67_00620 [Anaerolineaceae bacterium]|nr:hypothetical protein [Anaerolineaceae bacterium]